MIRTAPPLFVPPFWEPFALAARRTRRALTRRRDKGSRLEVSAFVSAPVVDQGTARQVARAGFATQYETLVDVLCAAAHHGSTPSLEAEYADCREWLARHYGFLKAELSRHLPTATPPPNLLTDNWLPGISADTDTFETLFLPSNLALLLSADNGTLIHRLTETQNALESWQLER